MVFGRVVGEGSIEVVRAIEGVGCRSGDTDSPVRITACGEEDGTVVGGWTRRRKNRSKKIICRTSKILRLDEGVFSSCIWFASLLYHFLHESLPIFKATAKHLYGTV